MSVLYDIYDHGTGNFVAQAHAYVALDGTLLAGGRLDPKILVLNGVTYHPG
jgi:hypothetical protein